MGSRLVPAAIVSPTDPLAAATIMRGRFDAATALVPAASWSPPLTLLWPSSRLARFGVETFSCDNKIRKPDD
jgi:hypothetical protein